MVLLSIEMSKGPSTEPSGTLQIDVTQTTLLFKKYFILLFVLNAVLLYVIRFIL